MGKSDTKDCFNNIVLNNLGRFDIVLILISCYSNCLLNLASKNGSDLVSRPVENREFCPKVTIEKYFKAC